MLEELFLNHLLRLVLLFYYRLDKATHAFRLGRPRKNAVAVTPVPATDSAMPRATATCAVLVIP